jgi:putative peptidoglycan lipid II flippase
MDGLGFQRLHMGAVGLALGATVGAWLEYGLLRRSLGGLIGPHGAPASAMLRITLAAALGVATGVGLQLVLPAYHPALVAVETLVPGGVVYLLASWALGLGNPLRILRRRGR